MTDRPLRRIAPRRWSSLAIAGATLSLAAVSPAPAQMAPLAVPSQLGSDLVLVQDQGGEGGEAATPAPAAAAEGGEGGESGATVGAPPDVAYLSQLAIVEGHMRAAATLYAKGMTDDAVALSYHPEAEMMDEVRAALSAHGAADITPAMSALSAAMEAGAPLAEVEARLGDVRAAIAAAAAVEADEVKVRFQALVLLTNAAVDEYEGAVADGKVADPMAYHESWAFLQVARDLAADLAKLPDAAAARAAGKVTAALAGADAAFGDIMAADPVPQDPGILLAVAGRVELAASAVR